MADLDRGLVVGGQLRRLGLVALLAAVLVGAFTLSRTSTTHAGGAALDPSGAAQDYAALDNFRASQGVPALSVSDDLAAKARYWALNMATQKRLYHSDLRSGLSGSYALIGENVGYGPSVASVETAFENSPAHRANELDPRFTEVGIGVATDDSGEVWIAQEFGQPSAAPPSTTAPMTAPPTSAPRPVATTAKPCGG